MITQEEIQRIRAKAKINAEKISDSLPLKLKEREDNLVTRFSKHKGNSLTKLKALYDFMDELYSFVNQHIPCKKSCSYCCYYEVSISEIEVQFIEQSLKIKRLKNKYSGIFHGTPCPFLKEQVCSIYLYRPFFCRYHITLKDLLTYCHPDVANEFEVPMFHFSEVIKVYNMIIQENQSDMFDIREAFG
jgi:hypothetical protein